jgi:hypothetical protein
MKDGSSENKIAARRTLKEFLSAPFLPIARRLFPTGQRLTGGKLVSHGHGREAGDRDDCLLTEISCFPAARRKLGEFSRSSKLKLASVVAYNR